MQGATGDGVGTAEVSAVDTAGIAAAIGSVGGDVGVGVGGGGGGSDGGGADESTGGEALALVAWTRREATEAACKGAAGADIGRSVRSVLLAPLAPEASFCPPLFCLEA